MGNDIERAKKRKTRLKDHIQSPSPTKIGIFD